MTPATRTTDFPEPGGSLGAGRSSERRNADGGESERPPAPIAGTTPQRAASVLITALPDVNPGYVERLLKELGVAARVRNARLSDVTGAGNPTDVVLIGDAVAVADMATYTREMQAVFPESGLVVVVSAPERVNARTLVAAGADGVVLMSQLASTLAPAILSVLSCQLSVPRQMWLDSGLETLPERQRESLGMAVAGLSTGEIATRMHVSKATVNSHLVSAYRRLRVHSRGEAAVALLGERGESRT